MEPLTSIPPCHQSCLVVGFSSGQNRSDFQVRLKPFVQRPDPRLRVVPLPSGGGFNSCRSMDSFRNFPRAGRVGITLGTGVLVLVEQEPLHKEVPPSTPVGSTHRWAFRHECRTLSSHNVPSGHATTGFLPATLRSHNLDP
jgi:hypothetical protein